MSERLVRNPGSVLTEFGRADYNPAAMWEDSMRRTRVLVLLAGLTFVGGCGVVVPDKVQITDVESGHTYTTYDDDSWRKENMLGYNFYDADSGERVMLKSYTQKTIRRGGYFDPNSAEAEEYRADVAKVQGVAN
jgi:hypothetical protein